MKQPNPVPSIPTRPAANGHLFTGPSLRGWTCVLKDLERDLRPGLQVGRWTLIAPAGAGGMGELWRARSGADEAALKFLLTDARPGTGTWNIEARRLRSEAEILRRLPTGVGPAFLEEGRTLDGRPFFAMELLEGESLDRRLERDVLSQEETCLLLREVASSLDRMHRVGLVHRDIKPANLYLMSGDSSRPKLIDFGVSRANGSEPLTREGSLVGTPGYLPPEMLRYSSHVGPAADIYALGCTAYRMLAGRSPFIADNRIELYRMHMMDTPPPLPGSVPEKLSALIQACLAKDPEDRPSANSMRTVLQALVPSRSTSRGLAAA